MKIIIVIIVIVALINPNARFWIKSIPTLIRGIPYVPVDIYRYFKNQEWKKFKGFGISIYTGLFGTGKSLGAVDYVRQQYMKYKVKVYSNIKLFDIPYIPLENFDQIIHDDGNSIFLIDELSTLFNSRQWSNFPIDLLFQLLQVRKDRKQLVTTAQRFAHVDKLIRDVTQDVICCSKRWRYCTLTCYDAFDYENTPINMFIQPKWKIMYLATDKLYNSYDTTEIIDNAKKTEFISNKEILENRGESAMKMPENMSRKGKKYMIKNK